MHPNPSASCAQAPSSARSTLAADRSGATSAHGHRAQPPQSWFSPHLACRQRSGGQRRLDQVGPASLDRPQHLLRIGEWTSMRDERRGLNPPALHQIESLVPDVRTPERSLDGDVVDHQLVEIELTPLDEKRPTMAMRPRGRAIRIRSRVTAALAVSSMTTSNRIP